MAIAERCVQCDRKAERFASFVLALPSGVASGFVISDGALLMNLGGWGRLWIAVSLVWGLVVIALIWQQRPTRDSVEHYLDEECAFRGSPSLVVTANGQVVQIGSPQGNTAAEVLAFAKLHVTRDVNGGKYGDIPVIEEGPWTDYESKNATPAASRAVLLPKVFDASTSCLEQVHLFANGTLLRPQFNQWLTSSIVLALSLPTALLFLGVLTGWVRRGFKGKKP
jgi:hypothetical protein